MSQHDDETRILKIRTLNDEFRRTFEGGRILFTPGVMETTSQASQPADRSNHDLYRIQ